MKINTKYILFFRRIIAIFVLAGVFLLNGSNIIPKSFDNNFYNNTYSNILNNDGVPSAKAIYEFTPTGGQLVVGTENASSATNVRSYRGAFGSDDILWSTTRTNPGGTDKQVYFDNVELYGANKMIITIEDRISAASYTHQVCDWVSTTGVDNIADTQCTGGGWRTLHPRKTTYTNTADTSRNYEIYDGYFSTRVTTPGSPISTPLTNFINTSNNNRILIRVYSTITSNYQHHLDVARVEVAVDPVYEPANMTITSAGTTTNYISDLVGAVSTNLTASDDTKMTVPMPAISQAADIYFSFSNIKAYKGMNTILVSPEVCVSNAALTFGIYAYNFNSSSWTQLGGSVTGSVCATDTEYGYAFNSTTIPSFNFADHISNSGEARIRFATNTPGTVYNMQFDRVYMMLGSVNTDSSQCEISWGTGTATNCVNTRDTREGKTATPATTTWQATAVTEYTPTAWYPQDNDADGIGAEYATSQNESFPITVSPLTSVTAIHYAAKYRSNNATQTMDPQIRDYSGIAGTSGWINTPSTDTNAATTYSWSDSWVNAEYQTSPDDNVNTSTNNMNMRMRTSAGTTTNPGTRDWDFAMMSVRWIEETNRRTLIAQYPVTGGQLVTGSEVASSVSNVRSYRGSFGSDDIYWTTARANPGGLNKQVYFDNVELYGANKMIITIEDTNITTGNAYIHQICDWTSTTSVDNAADAQCTGGGWRTLHPRKTTYTNTADTSRNYEIYDGYFSTRVTTPGSPISTLLTNFINTGSNNRVLIRTYSTVASTVQHRLDVARVEVAVDPVYEPANMTITSAGTTTNYISDLVGAVSTNLTASDGNKITIPMPAISQAVDFYYIFKNINSYSTMNTILVSPEICVSNTALTFGVYARRFSNGTWTQLGGSVTGSACATDTEYGYAFNSTTIPGFTLSDYISGTGEIWIRFLTNSPGTVYNMQFDRIYMMLGSVNTDSSQCEISWGTGTATNCVNTRDTREGKTATPATSTWQATAVTEYTPTTWYPQDNDADGTGAEYAASQNMSFPVSVGANTSITGVHYAAKYRSNNAAQTMDPQIRDYSGVAGTSGWVNTPSTDTNAATTYSWSDSWVYSEYQTSPDDNVNTSTNNMNMRMRTSAGTAVNPGTRDWDFAMMSVRWAKKDAGILSVDIVDAGGVSVGSPSVGFSALTTQFQCQTTTGTLGVSAEKIRVSNATRNNRWTLSIAPSGGAVATWQAGGSAYDFNDPNGIPVGCADGGDVDSVGGQLTINPSVITITPESGCTRIGLSVGGSSAFNQGVTDSITLLSTNTLSQTECYWDITGATLSQTVPSSQGAGSYSLPMVVSVIAN